MSAKYVICIDNKAYPRDLALHKVYKVLSTQKEEESGWVRIVDETGEDYLYESYHFVPVELPKEAMQSFNLEVA